MPTNCFLARRGVMLGRGCRPDGTGPPTPVVQLRACTQDASLCGACRRVSPLVLRTGTRHAAMTTAVSPFETGALVSAVGHAGSKIR